MGVIGVCAGGYALLRREEGAFSNVQLVNAHLLDGEHWARGVGMLRVKAEGAEDDAGFEMQYYNGPLWTPPVDDTFPEYTVLARFVDDIHEGDAPEGVVPGTPAIVAAPFGGGRVVLFSPHPELTPGKGGLLVNAVKWAARGGLGEDEVISWGNVFGEK
jgi:hypothetical protein